MQVWSVPPAINTPARNTPHDTAASLIGCIARDDFATRALGELNRALPVAWWTIYRLDDIGADQPPRLCAQASHAVPDIALDCWRIYRNGVYRDDTPFAQACDQADRAAGSAVMTHCVADDFGTAHREQIYTAHSLSERLSLVSAERGSLGSRALLAVNLYRHRAQPRFDAAELDTMLELAGALLAVVQRHLELNRPVAPALRLQQRCPQLTRREREVCERLLRGWTFEGIAADLRLSATTVKTYRNRAFERLGIQHRNQLFGLALQDPP